MAYYSVDIPDYPSPEALTRFGAVKARVRKILNVQLTLGFFLAVEVGRTVATIIYNLVAWW